MSHTDDTNTYDAFVFQITLKDSQEYNYKDYTRLSKLLASNNTMVVNKLV